MSAYFYKVTGKKTLDKNGVPCNIAVFAFKESRGYGDWDHGGLNIKMYRESGCSNADRYVEKGKGFTGRVILEGEDLSVMWGARPNSGAISDYVYDRLLDKGL